ncbi:MAG: hypothetical protein QOE99_495, partial [Actinomycetota bacterium]|nr:hypothetical protein [Actinomycetota bacterium]
MAEHDGIALDVPGSSRSRRLGVLAVCLLVGVVGGGLGIVVAAHENARVGPVDVRFELQPSTAGGSQVRIPPLGTMEFAT